MGPCPQRGAGSNGEGELCFSRQCDPSGSSAAGYLTIETLQDLQNLTAPDIIKVGLNKTRSQVFSPF